MTTRELKIPQNEIDRATLGYVNNTLHFASNRMRVVEDGIVFWHEPEIVQRRRSVITRCWVWCADRIGKPKDYGVTA